MRQAEAGVSATAVVIWAEPRRNARAPSVSPGRPGPPAEVCHAATLPALTPGAGLAHTGQGEVWGF
jgi:hypothetical protein